MSLTTPSGMPAPEPSEATPWQPASWKRRDNLPVWVIILLILFVAERFYDVAIASWLSHRSVSHSAAVPDTEAMQDVIGTDLQAKTAYVLNIAHPSASGQPDAKTLRTALKSAEEFQKDSHNAPEAARRVIILRALLNLPPLQISKNGLDPLAAFTTGLPSETTVSEKADYADEARLWSTLFRQSPVPAVPNAPKSTPVRHSSWSASQTAAQASLIHRLLNIRWWRYPALSVLYQRSDNATEANRAAKTAQQQAILTIVPASLLRLLRLGLLLLGILMLAYFLIRFVQGRQTQNPPGDGTNPMPDLWPTVAPSITFAERKLGAGDLMAVFVSYLVTRDVLELLLTGFSGFGPTHLLGFPGLLAPLKPILKNLGPNQRSLTEAVLEAAHYLLSALLPVLYLLWMARQRNASLADEIGWNRRHFGQNVLYGLGGYAVATPLFFAAALLGSHVFRNAPTPSNPVIPQIINAPGLLVPLILLLLASVAAPFVEELLFRGVFYNAAKLRLGVWPAIVLTGLVFGFAHPVGVAEMVALATLGGVFAWMAETRKSLLPSIVAHGLNNFLTTMLLFLVLSS